MREYRADRALVTGSGWLPKAQPQRDRDISRSHAANWAAGVGIISFCGYVLGWFILALFVSVPLWTVVLCVPVSVCLGASWGAVKLLDFTSQHREWLYYLEEETQLDIDQDGTIGAPVMLAGTPPDGCMIRGLDGAMHRINTSLSQADIHAVKGSMLAGGTFGVRAINGVLGDETRASGLRLELHRLGILEPPQARQATRLTSEGKRAVMRWA